MFVGGGVGQPPAIEISSNKNGGGFEPEHGISDNTIEIALLVLLIVAAVLFWIRKK